MPNIVSVNYRRLKTTASQATLEATTSTLIPEGPHQALLLDISTGSIYRRSRDFSSDNRTASCYGLAMFGTGSCSLVHTLSVDRATGFTQRTNSALEPPTYSLVKERFYTKKGRQHVEPRQCNFYEKIHDPFAHAKCGSPLERSFMGPFRLVDRAGAARYILFCSQHVVAHRRSVP